jgi:hypothetical protein
MWPHGGIDMKEMLYPFDRRIFANVDSPRAGSAGKVTLVHDPKVPVR